MSMFQTPRPAALPPFVRPRCAGCGAPMLLARVDSDQPGQDLRIFECNICDRFETLAVNFNDRA
jgi:hypothetical protein